MINFELTDEGLEATDAVAREIMLGFLDVNDPIDLLPTDKDTPYVLVNGYRLYAV